MPLAALYILLIAHPGTLVYPLQEVIDYAAGAPRGAGAARNAARFRLAFSILITTQLLIAFLFFRATCAWLGSAPYRAMMEVKGWAIWRRPVAALFVASVSVQVIVASVLAIMVALTADPTPVGNLRVGPWLGLIGTALAAALLSTTAVFLTATPLKGLLFFLAYLAGGSLFGLLVDFGLLPDVFRVVCWSRSGLDEMVLALARGEPPGLEQTLPALLLAMFLGWLGVFRARPAVSAVK